MKLRAGGYLAFYMPRRQRSTEIPLPAPAALKEILVRLQIPLAEVHLVAINGEQADLQTAIVLDADEVHIFSSVDGG